MENTVADSSRNAALLNIRAELFELAGLHVENNFLQRRALSECISFYVLDAVHKVEFTEIAAVFKGSYAYSSETGRHALGKAHFREFFLVFVV